MHIPPPEFMLLYNKYEVYGTKAEWVACPNYNSGIIQILMDYNSTKYLFVGHNHNNDFGGVYKDKIELVFGRKTGYGGYDTWF